MKILFQFLRLTVQAGLALVVGVVYYLLVMAVAVFEGFESLIGQPIVAIVLTSAAVGLLLVVSLPMRMVPKLDLWWTRHWWLPLMLGGISCLMAVAAWLPSFQVMMIHPEYETEVASFNPGLGWGGWLLAIFAALNVAAPIRLGQKKRVRES